MKGDAMEKIRVLSSGRNVLLALLLFLFALIAMNIAATMFYRATGGYGLLDLGGGPNLLDDRGSYTPAGAYALISHYGAAGIARYYKLLVSDIFFPAILGLFAMLALIHGTGRAFPGKRWLEFLALLPLAYTLADWSENVGIVTMLMNYPRELPEVAQWTNVARGMKSLLANTSLLLVVIIWSAALWRSVRCNRQCGSGLKSLLQVPSHLFRGSSGKPTSFP